jgi:hypothetical protein
MLPMKGRFGLIRTTTTINKVGNYMKAIGIVRTMKVITTTRPATITTRVAITTMRVTITTTTVAITTNPRFQNPSSWPIMSGNGHPHRCAAVGFD